ncbi:MAG: DUF3823 domain-containing protein [Tannerellaceae bacterium]|nr:DUF3823 domain-containing protein [Tannerellaceae bacterium]
MKNRCYIGNLLIGALLFTSCEMFQMDNYAEPKETIKGEIVDAITGERVLTDQSGDGIRIRLRELSWTETETPVNYDFYCMKEGVYQNTKVFKGHYNVRIDGPFIPLVRLNQTTGDTIADETKYIDIKGVTEVNFQVKPFLKVEWAGTPAVSDGKITASFRVTRGISPEDFKAIIEPLGSYNADFLDVTDVRLLVSQVPYVGFSDRDDRYSVVTNYTGDAFNSLLGTTITITTNSNILAGRTVWIRAAARIRYLTENVSRYNYNEAVRVDIPE